MRWCLTCGRIWHECNGNGLTKGDPGGDPVTLSHRMIHKQENERQCPGKQGKQADEAGSQMNSMGMGFQMGRGGIFPPDLHLEAKALPLLADGRRLPRPSGSSRFLPPSCSPGGVIRAPPPPDTSPAGDPSSHRPHHNMLIGEARRVLSFMVMRLGKPLICPSSLSSIPPASAPPAKGCT